MIRPTFSQLAVAAMLAVATLAGCSSNAGFGASPPFQPQAPNPTNPPFAGGTPVPGASAVPTATPTTPLTVDSATARFAYDASAADPVKAPRLVEITFALNNPGASPMPVPNLAVAADTNAPVNIPLSLQAQANQDTVETLVAIAPPKDYSKTKQLSVTFGDGKSSVLAQDTIDFPTDADPVVSELDKKQPVAATSLDDVAVTSISAPGSGLHYDLTFSLTNASNSKASIAFITVTPPKGDPVKIAVPIDQPARTGTAPISVVVPYLGKDAAKAKALPDGKYSIAASDGKNTIASGSGPLL
jgi:hypothetical protein